VARLAARFAPDFLAQAFGLGCSGRPVEGARNYCGYFEPQYPAPGALSLEFESVMDTCRRRFAPNGAAPLSSYRQRRQPSIGIKA